MMKKYLFLFIPILLLTACGRTGSFNNEFAKGRYAPEVEQCVPFAREVSGIQLRGTADSWWQNAPPRYNQGAIPTARAVLVLKATSHMPSGHVAVVKRVLDARKIEVTHSNWADGSWDKRITYDRQLAVDASPTNDWSQVRFWNYEKHTLGFLYAAYGFIYP